jgi:hypothetical protein
VTVAGVDANRAVPHDRLDPVAVPLDLEQPVRVVERPVGEGRQHRLQEARGAGALRRGQVDRRDGCGRGAQPIGVAVRADLVVGAPGLDAPGVILGVPSGHGRGVALLDEQPLLAVVALERAGRGGVHRPPGAVGLAGSPAGADDREPPGELLADEPELQLAVADRGRRVRRLGLGLERPPVPDDDIARPVLASRDHALEVEVLDGMVLDVDRHPSLAGVERGPARHRPADQHPVDLEADVVVEPGRAVPLDHEPALRPGRDGRRRVGRLGRLREVALAAVLLERHGGECAADPPSARGRRVAFAHPGSHGRPLRRPAREAGPQGAAGDRPRGAPPPPVRQSAGP